MTLPSTHHGGPAWRWLARSSMDLLLAVAAGAAIGLLVTPMEIASDEGLVDGLSRSVVSLHGNRLLDGFMLDITSLGDESLLIAVSLCLAWWSYRQAGLLWARFFGSVMVGGLLLDNIIKPIVGRARPDFDQLVGGRGDSFPSGHATAMTALLFAATFYITRHTSGKARRNLWICAIFGSALMALSRVFVGVHWPTDVIAGVALGATWTWMCVLSQGVLAPRKTWSRRVYIPVWQSTMFVLRSIGLS